MVKALGLLWNTFHDSFEIKLEIETSAEITMRNVLSDISKFFDPLGFITPVIINAKLFMQQLWLLKINWDQNLPPYLQKIWNEFKTDILSTAKITIPRWCFNATDCIRPELHGFADSSTKAYGACLYVRAFYTDNTVSIKLLCSKSKVAPLKPTSIPRLELCAALLLARLLNKIKKLIPLTVNETFLWSDSKVALCWLQAHPSKWK